MFRSRPQPPTLFVRILRWAGVVLLSLVVLVAVLLIFFDWNWLKSTLGERLAESTGRDFSIEGDLDVQLGWAPLIDARGVRIGNADWAGPEDMVHIGHLQFRIDLWELLGGDVVLPDVRVADATINLSVMEDGTANWDFSPVSEAGVAAEVAAPDERSEFPIIGRLAVEEGKLRYRDASRGIELDADIAQVKGQSAESEEMISLAGKGTLQGKPFDLKIRGGSVLRLKEEEDPYPLTIEATVGGTRVAFDGTLTNPLQPEVFDIALEVSGPSLSDLFPLFGIPLPPTPPYSLAGRLKRDGALWTVGSLDGRVGDSDLKGDLSIDTGPEPPFMRADLTSDTLDFDDLAGFIGATPQTGKGETASREQKAEARTEAEERGVLPDVPIELSRLRAMNMDVRFTGKQIKAPSLPLENLHARLLLEDGLLTLEPVKFGAARGTIGGKVILDGRNDTPRVDADLLIRGLSLQPFFADTDMADLTAGKFGGRIVLTGKGRSLADVLATSDGETTLAMTGGTLSPLLVELIGLDIAQSLAIVVTNKETPVRIRCAFGQFKVERGTMRTDGIVIDTTDSTLLGTGAINLAAEKLALRVESNPKDVSPLSANAPIAIMGPFGNPEISIDPTDTAGEGIFDSIVSLADPILALLPVVDLGTAEDRDCAALMRGDVKGSKKEEPK